ncbi:hypothetical protein BDP27DRAFT_1355860 [Rhodocollybia butyracea]|uniref:Hydrophobin n=1 Tax=Rhodocollybia butyracea TaxID=206335 RepID=A0A9P5TUU3_9AGAR|nr:hypothetical protein BDP27DRAFT_1355860 [Rhodocollybia butyracea]
MQFKLAFVSAALATLALASPTARNEPASSCSTGPVQCLIGLTCSGINIAGGGTCSAQAVCCTDNAVGGLISVGCAPVTL